MSDRGRRVRAVRRDDLTAPSEPGFTRRDFIGAVGRAGIAAAALASLPTWARKALAASGDVPADIIVRNDYPEHWETTVEALGRNWITPNDAFFVRSHFVAPDVKPDSYQLEVIGRVKTPLTLPLAEVRSSPATTAVHTLECAGNGRGLFPLANSSGTQWGLGAVGNAEWTGTKLSALLERAGVTPEAKHVWFECADAAPMNKTPKFVRSIPIEKAMRDVLVVHTMNGSPLPKLHGAPVRIIVPGWFGMASAKWVTRIRVDDKPSNNHFMIRGYRYVEPGGDPTAAPPVEELRVKSLITKVAASGTAGRARLEGFAWAGPKGVKAVEVSNDAGKTWKPATLTGRNEPLAWRSWTAEVAAKGHVSVLARATDGGGAVQPLAAKPNVSGYGNNSCYPVAANVP